MTDRCRSNGFGVTFALVTTYGRRQCHSCQARCGGLGTFVRSSVTVHSLKRRDRSILVWPVASGVWADVMGTSLCPQFMAYSEVSCFRDAITRICFKRKNAGDVWQECVITKARKDENTKWRRSPPDFNSQPKCVHSNRELQVVPVTPLVCRRPVSPQDKWASPGS